MNENCGIYKITNPIGQVYIGQSVDLKRRIVEYRCISSTKGQPKLYTSLNKYEWKNHQFDIIEYCSEEDLNSSERFWQDEFDVIGKNGLNCVLTKTNSKSGRASEETKKKVSEATKGEKNPNYGKHWSEEWKQKHSDFMQGRQNGEKNACWGLFGEKHPAFGTKRTEEYKIARKNKSKGKANTNAKTVYDTVNIKYYASVVIAAETLGLNKYTLRSRLNGHLKNNTGLIYYDHE